MRALTLTLGVALAAYAGAGLLTETLWPHSERANRVLCSFLLCTNAPILERGGEQLLHPGAENARQAAAVFRTALERDPQNPYRWADLGDACLDAGRTDQARYCYRRVAELAPNFAPLLLRAANFQFEATDPAAALPLTARVLALTPNYDEAIFSEYVRLTANVDAVLRSGMPRDPRAAKMWLRFLMQAGSAADAQRSWQWMCERRLDDDALTGEYAVFLIRQGRPDAAADAWAQHLGSRAGDYGKTNYLFNGDFALEPAASPFDWNLARTPGVEVARDCTAAQAGECSLRMSFAGTQNLNLAMVSQFVAVRPGAYRFEARIRTEALTTDQGLRFRIADAEAPSRLEVVFGQFTGSNPWSAVDYDFLVPPATRLLQVQMIRQPSLKFDNKVAGTAWVNAVKLEPMMTRTAP